MGWTSYKAEGLNLPSQVLHLRAQQPCTRHVLEPSQLSGKCTALMAPGRQAALLALLTRQSGSLGLCTQGSAPCRLF